MTAAQLTDRYEIPRRDFRRKTGYQREVSATHVNRLVHDLEKKRVDLPTAVLLNLRNYEEETHLVRDGEHVWFSPNGEPLYVVDGQHRIEALKRLVEENPDEWSSFEVAFSCMLGATENEEMEEFYVVNSTAKSVRTDLALDLLKQRAEADPRIMDALLETGESWKVEAQALTEAIVKTNVWQSRVRFPGEPKANTMIGSNGMVGLLRELLANHFFGSIQRDQRLQILDAYWRGIQEVLPEAFLDPTEYAVQKSTGVQIMHRILIPILEYLRSVGKSVIEKESYVPLLGQSLLQLEGDTAAGEIAKGIDFWKSGSDGAAGSFSSNAGRRVLTARIKAALPPPEVA
jgi:DGQHR domain-containing protein